VWLASGTQPLHLPTLIPIRRRSKAWCGSEAKAAISLAAAKWTGQPCEALCRDRSLSLAFSLVLRLTYFHHTVRPSPLPSPSPPLPWALSLRPPPCPFAWNGQYGPAVILAPPHPNPHRPCSLSRRSPPPPPFLLASKLYR